MARYLPSLLSHIQINSCTSPALSSYERRVRRDFLPKCQMIKTQVSDYTTWLLLLHQAAPMKIQINIISSGKSIKLIAID